MRHSDSQTSHLSWWLIQMIFVIINIAASQCVKQQQQEKRDRERGRDSSSVYCVTIMEGSLVKLHSEKNVRMKRDKKEILLNETSEPFNVIEQHFHWNWYKLTALIIKKCSLEVLHCRSGANNEQWVKSAKDVEKIDCCNKQTETNKPLRALLNFTSSNFNAGDQWRCILSHITVHVTFTEPSL